MRRTAITRLALMALAESAAGVARPARAEILYTLKDLGTLGGTISSGGAVNDSGQIAGISSTTAGGAAHAFLSGPGGGALKDLGALPGFAESQGLAVNASGQVVGSADLPGHAPHALLYTGGQPGRADLGHPASRDVVGRP
jgi:probable HAF family extracellular repeat protein